jgi:hypothetical protein
MQVHLAVLPGDDQHHSKIVSWQYGHPFLLSLWGWSDSTAADCAQYPLSSFTPLPVDDPTPLVGELFCSGHSSLADGDLLIDGGHDHANFVGTRTSIVFHRNGAAGQTPSQQWSRQGDMAAERWYPTNVSLPDGKVATFTGTRFFEKAVFGGTSQPQQTAGPATEDVNSMGLTSAGHWGPTITRPVGEPDWPSARDGHSAVWITGQSLNAMMIFGGRESGGTVHKQDAWSFHVYETATGYVYDWQNWTPATGSPPQRTRHGAIEYQKAVNDNRMIIFGGDNNGTPVNDVWEFRRSGASWTWQQLFPTGTAPSARYGHVVVADTGNGRNRMLVFGGRTASAFADSTVYALNLATTPPTWSTPTRRGTQRAPRLEGHTLVLDAKKRTGPSGAQETRYVLFGGRTGNGALTQGLWVLWVNSAGEIQWQQVAAPPGGPSARARHAAIWDRTENSAWSTELERMIVTGGDVGTSQASSEVWALNRDLTEWTLLETAPAGLAGHSAIYSPPVKYALDPERYDPATGEWTALSAPLLQPIYPFMFLLPSGNLFFAGPNRKQVGPTFPTYLLNRTNPAWSLLPANGNSGFDGGSAVMYRPGQIMKCGTEADVGETSIVGTTKKITIDASDQVVGGDWVSSTDMLPRAYHTTTLLPTGDVLVTGGLASQNWGADTTTVPGVRAAQIWYANSNQWGPALASDPVRRGYHSTAILLPDGRVLSAGGETFGTNVNYGRPTIYCPPYLFNADGSLAARPSIFGVPDTVNWGRRFTICTSDAASISSACLVRPGAVTHAFNQDQRYVPLPIVERCGNQLVVEAPADSNLAPPGFYLVFVVQAGVPSVGRWVQVISRPAWDACDGVRPAAVNDLVAAANRTSAIVTWTSPGDDSLCGVAEEYDLRMSIAGPITEVNFYNATRISSLPAPGPPGTEHCLMIDPLPQCTWHYFAIKTRDDRYQWSAASSASVKTKCSGTSGYVCEEGGMMAQQGGDGGWSVDNSLLPGPGSTGDLYALRSAPEVSVRLLKSGPGSATVDEARVGFVVHEPDEDVVAGEGRLYVGRLGPVARITDVGGADITADLSGRTDAAFAGEAGGSLTVVLEESDASGVVVLEWAGFTPGAPAESRGIEVQRPATGGTWQTVARLWPRRLFDRVAVDAGNATVRLLFRGECQVKSIRHLDGARVESPIWLETTSATHSRLGEVAAAVDAISGTSVALLPGESLRLQSDAAPVTTDRILTHVLHVMAGSATRESEVLRGQPGDRSTTQLHENSLAAAQPNPVAGEVKIGFALAHAGRADLRIYDVAGRRVRTLDLGWQAAGRHDVVWDGRGDDGARVRPGIYLYRMTHEGWIGQRKLVVCAS